MIEIALLIEIAPFHGKLAISLKISQIGSKKNHDG